MKILKEIIINTVIYKRCTLQLMWRYFIMFIKMLTHHRALLCLRHHSRSDVSSSDLPGKRDRTHFDNDISEITSSTLQSTQHMVIENVLHAINGKFRFVRKLHLV